MANFKIKTCKCGQSFKQYNSITDRYCSFECRKEYGKKSNLKLQILNPVSSKRQEQNIIYRKLKAEFMALPENKICPITGQPTVDIHHTYAGSNRSKFFLDTKTWMAVSRQGHNWIHDNDEKARELGYLKSHN